MAIPGNAAIQLDVRAVFTVEPPQATQVPGGLFPLRSAAFQVDEYRLMAGWPVPVPPCDIRAQVMVSGDGTVLGSRETPSSVLTGADVRWIADADYIDYNTLRWTPFQGIGPYWEGTVDSMPELIYDYEYRVGDERFLTNAVNFDSDTQNYMWTDFAGTLGGSIGYTMIMVFSPNSAYGNDVEIPYNGIWCYGGADPASDAADHWANFTIQGKQLYAETEIVPRASVISISDQLAANAPTFLAVVVTRPVTTVYVAVGPSAIKVSQTKAGDDPVPINSNVVLGRSTGDLAHTADMALFDLGMYNNALSNAEVTDEFALLSQIYGGDR